MGRNPKSRIPNPKSRHRTHGFTLIELVIVLAMLAMVLFTAYQILGNSLESEQTIERLALREKVGEGILALYRRDLAGVFYRGLSEHLNNQVFIGVDGELLDQVNFLTTVDPTPLEDGFTWEGFQDLRTVCAVSYFLEPNQVSPKYGDTYTLYRKETTDFMSGNVLDAPGLNQVIYDKVKSVDLKYYDGWEWRDDWNSELVMLSYEEEVLAEATLQSRLQQNIGRVTAPEEEEYTEPLMPPSPVPVAVRVELEIYVGTGNTIFEVDGYPDIQAFSTTIQLLAAQRIPIVIEDQAMLGEDGSMLDSETGVPGETRTFGAMPGQGSPIPSGRTPGAAGSGRGRGSTGSRGVTPRSSTQGNSGQASRSSRRR